MKVFLLTLVTLFSATAAFAPVAYTTSSSALKGVSGDEVRDARAKFAPGHFTTHGSSGDAGRSVVDGHEVRAARASYAQPGKYGEIGHDGLPRQEIIPTSGYSTSFAPGHFTTHGSSGDAGRGVVDGHEVRAARGSYAQPNRYGEIGLETTGAGGHAPVAAAAAPVFAPSAAVASAGAPKKSYALGAWKK